VGYLTLATEQTFWAVPESFRGVTQIRALLLGRKVTFRLTRVFTVVFFQTRLFSGVLPVTFTVYFVALGAALHLTVTFVVVAFALTFVTFPGAGAGEGPGAVGVTALLGSLASLTPTLLLAVTTTVYEVPLVKPVIVQAVPPVVEHDRPPGVAVAV
jgi:hypothetical protein